MSKYDDILYMAHPVSRKHPQMTMNDRAAQFAPFAALTGFEEATLETGRLTQQQMQLDDSQIAQLDEKLRLMLMHPEMKAEFTCFKPDEKKEGGSYCKVRGGLVRADYLTGTVYLDSGEALEIDKITEIELDDSTSL